MKKNLFNLLLIAVVAIAIASCSKDDETPTTTYDNEITSATDFDAANLYGTIASGVTVTLNATTNYYLTGALIANNGATLVIDPGTTIKAKVGGTDVYVAVKPGGKITAVGTATNPITITSAASNPRAGDWGGLIIAGNAKINNGPTATTEIAGLTYGGNDDADNSGTIDYMILEYTGARLNGEQEFNGFTFYGVGSGTTLSNLASLNGDDDGVEFFGGTAVVTNMLVVNAKDDMFDWTDGWRGKITNAVGIRESDYTSITEDPRGLEGDSNSDDNTAVPVSSPTFENLTLIHDAINVEMTDMIKIRRGSSVTITNAYVYVGVESTASDFIDFTDSKGDGLASSTITVVGQGVDITDIKEPVAGVATVTASAGTSGGAALSMFAWTGYTYTPVQK